MFSSLRHQLVLGLIVAALVAFLFWLYLNIQASMYVNAQKARLLLPESGYSVWFLKEYSGFLLIPFLPAH